MELTQDEIIQILNLIEGSNFGELRLEMGDLKLIVIKGDRAGHVPHREIARSEDPGTVKPSTIITEQHGITGRAEKTRDSTSPTLEEGLLPIKANLLGIFYTRPEPGAPPYVEVGSFVEEDTTVGLIEVMKLFNAVKAGMRGYIEKICVESGELVEYGQTLFLVRPA